MGNFIRAKRDSIQPESLGLPDRGRRRSPGLRRQDLATWAGISVEYLILAHTSGYQLVTSGTGLLDAAHPNLNRYLFTDPRARTFFVDWDDIADEQAFDLWQAPSLENLEWLTAELTPIAGPDFTRRLKRHVVPRRGILRLNHPAGQQLRLLRETLELPAEAQQLVVFLPADDQTAEAIDQLQRQPHGRLRSIS